MFSCILTIFFTLFNFFIPSDFLGPIASPLGFFLLYYVKKSNMGRISALYGITTPFTHQFHYNFSLTIPSQNVESINSHGSMGCICLCCGYVQQLSPRFTYVPYYFVCFVRSSHFFLGFFFFSFYSISHIHRQIPHWPPSPPILSSIIIFSIAAEPEDPAEFDKMIADIAAAEAESAKAENH